MTQVFPEGMEEYVRSIAKGKGSAEIMDLINQKYGSGTITLRQVKAYKKNHHISSGLTGQFVKGQPSFNKGLKQTDFMSQEAIERTKATRFQKGNIPHNGGTPVGTLRLRKATAGKKGSKPYWYEKVEQPNKWRMKHILVWEAAHGPVPEGYILNFANGNTLDYRLENLLITTRARHAVKNHLHMKGYDMESAKAIDAIAGLRIMKSRKKGGKKG